MITIGKTVYCLTDGTYIHCDNDSIVFELSSGMKQKLAYHVISEIIIFHTTTLSTYVMDKCGQHNIIVHYISNYGYYKGSYFGRYSSNVILRKCQFDMISDNQKSLLYVRNLLCAKIKNSMWTLRYFGHHAADSEAIKITIGRLKSYIDKLKSTDCIDDLRILEANAASEYFSVFDDLLKVCDNDMQFERRSRRPPLNNINALLSFFYTLATSISDSALMCRGLDSECGYLHTLRSGRHSLACDFVEEFRSCIVDRFVITIVNRKEVVASDFVHDNDGIYLTDEAKRKLLQKWDNYLDTTFVVHPLYDKKLSLRLLFYEQAQYLAQYIRGDICDYPAFLMR